MKNCKTKFVRSRCPITNSLDLFGDKWTILVIRDLVLGKERYHEFLLSPEKIATNILSNRLKRLEVAGVIVRHVYQHSPTRYEYVLTRKGIGLKPILKSLASWGLEFFPGSKIFPPISR